MKKILFIWGLFASLVVMFWALIAYVIVHFIKKFW